MPVRKYRRVEEMAPPPWRQPGDPQLYRAIAGLWAFGRRAAQLRFPPGVYRHRSVGDLNHQTERWSEANVRAREAINAGHRR